MAEEARHSSALSYTVVTPPAHGTLSGTGASLTYAPAADFNGSDTFTFVAVDGTATSAPATEPTGGCGCGTSGDVAPLGVLLLGLLGFRPRRRVS